MAQASCSLFGCLTYQYDFDAATSAYYGLHAQQHRGHESAGIAVFNQDQQTVNFHKGPGFVLDVFKDPASLQKLRGLASVGHTRYGTSGSKSFNPNNVQPLVATSRFGQLALCHNGHISNFPTLKQRLVDRGTLFSSTGDSEVVLHLIAQSSAQSQIGQVLEALSQIEGAFSLLLLTDTSIIVARDPHGFRPLSLAENKEKGHHYVASETCAFDICGATFVRDVNPGEVLVMPHDPEETFITYRLPPKGQLSPCVFEYVYFSRPDSKVFGKTVDDARRNFGRQLARESPFPSREGATDQVVVVPVPDSSNTAALGYARECQDQGLNCVFELGIIRNHYVGRTFLAPTQDQREMKVRCKFNAVRDLLENKIVVLVDDSVVRGTTSKQLVKMVRKAGAKEVHFRVASPPVTHPCFYGMDFPSKNELLMTQFKSETDPCAAAAAWMGADSLAYLSLEGLIATARKDSTATTFCQACFSGKYPTNIEW